jgi:hypothetical protein
MKNKALVADSLQYMDNSSTTESHYERAIKWYCEGMNKDIKSKRKWRGGLWQVRRDIFKWLKEKGKMNCLCDLVWCEGQGCSVSMWAQW